MKLFSKKERADIYLKCAQNELLYLTNGSYFIGTLFKDHTPSGKKVWEKFLPELKLCDGKHKTTDSDIKNVRVLAYLFAYQMTLNP